MKNKPHFISICSQKGGVGKSTFTILLAGMLHYLPIASCFFVCRKYLRHTKRPGLRSRPGWFSLQSRITYKKITMANGKSGRPKAKDPKTHRYNFKLNDEQELHFRRMLEEAGYRENISKFILARLFG